MHQGQGRVIQLFANVSFKSVTDEQVFYDKFLCDKFYFPSFICVYATNFI